MTKIQIKSSRDAQMVHQPQEVETILPLIQGSVHTGWQWFKMTVPS